MLYKLLYVDQNTYINNEFKFVIFKNKTVEKLIGLRIFTKSFNV